MTLGLKGKYPIKNISYEQLKGLKNLGIELVTEDTFFKPLKIPLFDLQYDMP